MRRLKEDIRTALPKLTAGRYKTVYADPPWDWMQGGHNLRSWQSGKTGRSNRSMIGATPYVRLSVKSSYSSARQSNGSLR